MLQRLHEPTRATLLPGASFFHGSLLVWGPVAVLLMLATLVPAELGPEEVTDTRWALASATTVTIAAFGLLRSDRPWARWLMMLGIATMAALTFRDPFTEDAPTFAVQTGTLVAAFGFGALLPWIQDSSLAHRFRAWRGRRHSGAGRATPVEVSPDEALVLLYAVLPDGFAAGLREGRACAWWADEASGRAVAVHTPGRGWVSTEVESGHADVQCGDGGPDELAVALRRAVSVAVAYRSGDVAVDDRRTGTPLGGELLVLAEDGWHVLRRPQHVWADPIRRRAWAAVRGRRA